MAKGNEPKSKVTPLEDLIGKPKDTFTGFQENIIDRQQSGIKDSDYEDYGIIRKNTDINQIRQVNQSGLEQTGSFLTRAGGEIVGGAISGIGATLELPVAVFTEMGDGNADFENFLTRFGDSISEGSKEIAPIYRKNPGKTFDISDGAWWAENGVSVASTLSLMIPATGAVKGLSYLGKVAREVQGLGKVMKGVDAMSDLKYYSKIATAAAVSRNAENFKESFQVLNETKGNLLKEWEEDPNKFNDVLKTDVVKELQQEGKQATKENVADFIATKAGWLSYGVNSMNIAFDLVQFAPLFKGYKPKLQTSLEAESLDVLKAQASAVGKTLTKGDYITHFLRPTGVLVGQQLSEGVEEAINYIGGEEGKNYANQLAGKETKELSSRLLNYIKDDKMWESAAWGVMGGIAFSGVANGLGNIKEKMKSKDGQTLKNYRLEEINGRVEQIKKVNEAIKSVENDTTLSDQDKKEQINKIKFTNAVNGALNAIQVGNFDMYLEHLASDNMKKAMLESGYATEGDIDKAIAYSISDANTAAELYKQNYNDFQTKNIAYDIKNQQVIEKSYYEAQRKNEYSKLDKLNKEIELLKKEDFYFNNNTENNVSSTVKLTALKELQKLYSSFESKELTDVGASPVNQYQKKVLDRISNEVKSLEESIGEDKPNLSDVNFKIIEKTFLAEQKKALIEAYSYKTNFMATDEYTKILENNKANVLKEREDKDFQKFKEEIENDLKEGKHTPESLLNLKNDKQTKYKNDFLTSKINELKNKQQEEKANEELNTSNNLKTQEQTKAEKAPEISKPSKPTKKEKPSHEIYDFFDEDFKKHEIDETKVKDETKSQIDSYLQGEDYASLLSLHLQILKGIDVKYLENKITELKETLENDFNSKKEIVEENKQKEFYDETQIDEKAQWELENQSKPNINQQGGLMYKEIESKSENSESATIKPLLHILRPLDFNGKPQYSYDENNHLTVSQEIEDLVFELYNSKLGDEVEIKIDAENAFYEKNKENSKDIPLVVIKNGKKIAYLSSTSQFEYNKDRGAIDKNVGETEGLLLKNIRNEIGTDLTKSVKMTINKIQKGDIINTKEYYSIADMTLDSFVFWTLPPGTSSKNTLIPLNSNDKEYISNTAEYGKVIADGNTFFKKGLIYLGLKNVDGSFFPTPLKINKINEKEAEKVQNLAFKILKELNKGSEPTSEIIKNLKDEVKKYIRVDDTRDVEKDIKHIQSLRTEKFKLTSKNDSESSEELKNQIIAKDNEIKEYQGNRNISFRIYPKSKDKPARIEIGYLSPSTGEKRMVVVKEDVLAYYDNKNNQFGNFIKRNPETGIIGDFILNGVVEQNPLIKTLQFKYHNVDFKSFSTDKNYVKELIDNNVFQNNIGELRNSKGEVISNFTNFAIKLSLKEDKVSETSTDEKIEQKDEKSVDKKGFDDFFDDYNKISESDKNNVTDLKNTDSISIINTILENPQSQDIQLSAESIKDTVKNNNVKIEFVDSLPNNFTGSYLIKENKILINKNYSNLKELQETFLHEIYHSLTILPLVKHLQFNVLPNGQLDYGNYTFKNGTPQEIKDFLNQIENLKEYAEKKIKQKYPDITKAKLSLKYGIKNNFEFIAEIMSNPEFKEVLKDGDVNVIEKIIDAILSFLNKYFKTNFNTYKNENYTKSVKTILNLINTSTKIDYSELKGNIEYVLNSNFASFNKEKDAVFSNEEIGNIVNSTFYEASKILKKSSDAKFNENLKDDRNTKEQTFERIKQIYEKYNDKLNEEHQELGKRIIENFDIVWKATSKRLSSVYNVAEENENLDVKFDQISDLIKNWDSRIVDSLTSNNKLSKEIKWFLSSFPSITNGNYDINPVTGLPIIMNYADIIIPIRKNLTGVQSSSEIIKNLRNLNELNSIYGRIADALENNLSLLNSFESLFKTTETKQVAILLTPTDDGIKLARADEMNSAKDYKSFKSDWQKIINNNIDATNLSNEIEKLKKENKTNKEKENKLEEFLSKGAKIYDNKFLEQKLKLDKDLIIYKQNKENESFLNNENGITENGLKLVNIFSKQLDLIGLNVSLSTLKTSVKNSRNLNETLLNAIDGLFISIEQKKKKDSTGNLEKIGKIEAKFNFKYAEMQGLDIKKNALNNYTLPSFLSNVLDKWKSTDETVKEQVERDLREWAEKGEDIQNELMFWKTDLYEGMWEYELINGRKIPTKLNRNFLNNINLFQNGGSKNNITGEANSSVELSEFDYLISSLTNYLMLDENDLGKENKLFSMPSLTPSDSPTQTFITLIKTKLKKEDIRIIKNEDKKITKIEISRTSEAHKNIRSLVKQEVVRRKQAFDYIFDETLSNSTIISKDNNLTEKDKYVIKSNYFNYKTNKLTKEGKEWFKTLEQYYHYSKVKYLKDENGNSTNEIDLLNTLFDSNNNLTGRVWKFHNIKEINNNERFKNVNSKLVTEDYNNILPVIDSYLDTLIKGELEDFRKFDVEPLFTGKYNNIGDNSFESLIAEYAINNKIGNVTQQNLFYGSASQYKNDAEIGKRAKIFNAPGTAFSSNGAKSFYASTINDIILKSSDYDKIVEKSKNNIIEQYNISEKDKESFNINNISKDLGKNWKLILKDNKLELLTYEVVKDYLNINSGDAQGYITVAAMKEVLTKQGKMNNVFTEIFKQIESGEQLSIKSLKTLQAVKFLYCKSIFNPVLNKMTPVQIKNSYITLLPQFVKGTELEKIEKVMSEKGISRLNFESAHKVGATQIYKIHNEDGSLNENWLKDIQGTEFDYDGEQEQLTVPDHLEDNQQLLATQIAKLIIANLSNDAIYELNGKKLTGTELKEQYFDLLEKNIEYSKNQLIEELDLKIDEETGEYSFGNIENLKRILEEEVKDLNDNFINSLKIVNGRFLMPVSSGQNADKFESLLTSLFTNRIMKQKMPGASLVLTSDLFTKKIRQGRKVYQGYNTLDNRKINYYTELKKEAQTYGKNIREVVINTEGFFRRKDNEDEYVKLFNEFRDLTKQTFDILDNTKEGLKIQEAFFNFLESKGYKGFDLTGWEENRYIISFSEENKKSYNETGIEWQQGHNGQLKSYTEDDKLIVEVVMGSWSDKFFKDGKRVSIDTIPDEIKTMIGYRIPTQAKHSMVVFKVVGFLPEEQKGVIVMPNNIIPQTGSDFDIDKLYIMYKHFNINKKGEFNVPKYGDKGELNFLINDLKELKEERDYLLLNDNKEEYIQSIDNEILRVENEINNLKNVSNSKKSRDNEIIDIYKAILSNPFHAKEIHTPAAFDDFTNYAEELRKLKPSISNIDVTSAKGQRMVRQQNMVGIAIKGLSANFNAFLPIAQHTNMMVNSNNSFDFKFKIKGNSNNIFDIIYDEQDAIRLYGEENIEYEGDYIKIKFKHFGKTPKGYVTNLDGKVITEVASQSLGASVDNNKNPILEDSHINTYTFAQFQTGVSLGIPISLMQNFNNQPIIRKLSEKYMNNKSLLSNTEFDKSREEVRSYYEAQLYNELIKEGKISDTKIKNSDILKGVHKLSNLSKEKRFELFNYNIKDIKSFSSGELYNMIEMNVKKVKSSEYLKNQLYILNQFNRQKEAGDATSDVLKALKVDGIGAGPSLDINTELFDLIEKSNNKKGVVINNDDISAISQIYKKYFNQDGKSLYPHLESLFENVNKLSYEVLSSLFTTQNPYFLQFKNNVKLNTKKGEKNKELIKFFNKTLLSEFSLFNEKHIKQSLGIEKSSVKFDESIESFNQLTTVEKLKIVKNKLKVLLDNKKEHILNNLTIDTSIDNDYDKIIFNTNYKDVLKDNTFIEQLQNLYSSGDNFEKSLVISLIQYNYFTHGLEFGFGSLSKVLPTEILGDLGIGEHLHKINDTQIFIDEDIFYKNNWKNNNYVIPVTNKITKNDEDLELEEDNKEQTLVWATSNNVISQPSNLLFKQNNKIKNAKFIKIKHIEIAEDGSKLSIDKVYKKYQQNLEFQNVKIDDFLEIRNKLFRITKKEIQEDFVSLSYLQGKEEITIFDNNNFENSNFVPKTTYYYQVNTLGKDSIIEMSEKSIFNDNQVTNENKNLNDVQDLIFGVKEKTILNLENKSKEETDEFNQCNLPNS